MVGVAQTVGQLLLVQVEQAVVALVVLMVLLEAKETLILAAAVEGVQLDLTAEQVVQASSSSECPTTSVQPSLVA